MANGVERRMIYEVEFKCFAWSEAKSPRNARRKIRDILGKMRIFVIEPSFKVKSRAKKELKKNDL